LIEQDRYQHPSNVARAAGDKNISRCHQQTSVAWYLLLLRGTRLRRIQSSRSFAFPKQDSDSRFVNQPIARVRDTPSDSNVPHDVLGEFDVRAREKLMDLFV
jgi:hypothetical protein